MRTSLAGFLSLVVSLAAVATGRADDAAGTDGEAVRDLVFLGEERPVFLRLRVTAGSRPFEADWPESVRTLHACLDRDGDGKLTTKRRTGRRSPASCG